MSDELDEYPRPETAAVGSTEREHWLIFAEQISVKMSENIGSYNIPDIAITIGASRKDVARALYEACRAPLPEIGISGDIGEKYLQNIQQLQEYENLPRFTDETRFYHIKGASAAE